MNERNIDILDLRRLARWRRSLGITQKELARAVGLSQSYIAKLEAGTINPSYRAIKRIIEYLREREEALTGYRGILDTPVKNIHVTNIVYVDAGQKVSEAVELMWRNGFSQLPVRDGDKWVGSITEEGILRSVDEADDPRKIYNSPVSKIMDEVFPLIDENTPLSVVIQLLKYSQAVLTLRKGNVVGLVTKSDVMNFLSKASSRETNP